MNLSEIAIRRPVSTVMATATLLVVGVTGFNRLGSDLFPDVSFPAVVVTVPYPAASPSDVENLVVKPLENAVISLNGIDRVRAFAKEGSAQVFVLFKQGVPISEAATQVRERVSQVRYRFPPEAREPMIQRYDVSSAPVLTYALRGTGLSTLRAYAEDVLRPALEQVDGVAAVQVKGGAKREVHVELDRTRMDALRLTPAAIVQRLRSENTNLPAGRFDEGSREINVRVLAEFQGVDDIRQTIVATAANGSSVRLRDVANVTDGFEELRTHIHVDGQDAVVFEIRKQSGHNTVELAHAVKARMDELAVAFPKGVTTELIVDQSKLIEIEVKQVERDIVFGALMAVLVVLVFMLDLRSTVISALALPTSVIGTFFAMYLLGYSLNMMTLLALSLSIGLLIDDAVVVRENIYKHLEAGKSARQAALDGTREVSLSVLATTLTVIAVFMPIAFVHGLVGEFLRQFGTTVSVAVAISLFVAFTLDPMLSSRFSRAVGERGTRFEWLKAPFEWFHAQVELTYRVALHWAVRHRLAIAALVFGSVFLTGYVLRLTGQDFLKPEDHGQFNLEVELPAGTSLAETARASQQVERELLSNPEFRTLLATIGSDDQINKITWLVLATDKLERHVSLDELKEFARRAASKLEGAKLAITEPPAFQGAATEAPIMINVRGAEYPELWNTSAQIEQILHATPGLSNIQARYSPGRPELAVSLDRLRAADRGVSASDVATTLRIAVEGEEAGKLRQPGQQEDVSIKVRLDRRYRGDVAGLAAIHLPTLSGVVPLGDVVQIARGEGPQVIERENKQRQITLWATPSGRPLGDVAAEFQQQIAKLALPEGVSVAYDGQLRLMNENNQNMGLALLLGIAFIYIVLASQFESFIHPVSIMVTLPLALVGAILALFLTGNTLAMGPMIGMILLIGLVTKNAILLVDRAIVRVREHGEAPLDAMLAAGPERLRPILMTSAAMVLGMLPTALGTGEGSEWRAPMGIAIIGGVISSTMLSLIVVPVVYLSFESLKQRFAHARSWLQHKPASELSLTRRVAEQPQLPPS